MVVLIVIVNCPTCNSRQYHTEIQIHEYKIHQANLVPVQGEGDDRSLTDTLPEDSVSVTGSEMNTPNTIRKGEICFLFCSVKKMNTLKSELFLLFFLDETDEWSGHNQKNWVLFPNLSQGGLVVYVVGVSPALPRRLRCTHTGIHCALIGRIFLNFLICTRQAFVFLPSR